MMDEEFFVSQAVNIICTKEHIANNYFFKKAEEELACDYRLYYSE